MTFALKPTLTALLLLGTSINTSFSKVSAENDVAPSSVMESVYGNRIANGGFWRKFNDAYEEGNGQPRFWAQKWRFGPGNESVIVDAYQVSDENTCSGVIHIVYYYDQDENIIKSYGFGGHGMRASGRIQFDGSNTSNEATLTFPNSDDIRMRDHENHGDLSKVTVEVEIWNGENWVESAPAIWSRATTIAPCM